MRICDSAWRWIIAAIYLLALTGCVAHNLHGEGIALMDEGKYEQAVAKLGEASREAPRDVEYRRDFFGAREQVLNHLVMLGDQARAAQRFDAAETEYRRALAISPKDRRAQSRLALMARDRRHAALVSEAEALLKKGESEAAGKLLQQALLENPHQSRALALQQEIEEARLKKLVASPGLGAAFRKPVTLQFRDANLKMVFESISRSSGVNILLDKDVRTDLRTSIFVKEASVEDAIDLILLQNSLEKKVLSENTLLIYPQLPNKSRAYQDLKVRSFHLANADAKQMMALIKTMLKTKDIMIHEKTNSVIMRDTPEAVALAAKIVADQDIEVPEVMLEVEVLEVTHTLLSDLGIRYPDSVTLTPSVPGGGDLTVGNFSAAIQRDNLLVTPVPTVTFNASLNRGNTKILASPRLRTRTREKAKIHIGDRLPVFTNSVTPLTTGGSVTTGTVQYIDTGIKLEVEPDIHPNGEVTIKLALEVSVAQAAVSNPQSGTTAYPISTRTTSTVLQLKDGETNVIAGLIRDTEAVSKILVPGLGEIPGLGRLFGTHHTDGARTEIILSITPRLMGGTMLPKARFVEFWSGTSARPASEPFQLRPSGPIAMSAGGALPGTRSRAQRLSRIRPVPSAAAAQPASPVTFNWQGPAQAKVGSRFSLTLNERSGRPVGALGLTLSYDPSLLKAVDAVAGGFAGQAGSQAEFTREIDAQGGQITINARAGAEASPGAGSVATVTFEVLAAGEAQIGISQLTATAPGGESVEYAEPAAHSVALTP
jgi:general secretion pathway protein D